MIFLFRGISLTSTYKICWKSRLEGAVRQKAITGRGPVYGVLGAIQ